MIDRQSVPGPPRVPSITIGDAARSGDVDVNKFPILLHLRVSSNPTSLVRVAAMGQHLALHSRASRPRSTS